MSQCSVRIDKIIRTECGSSILPGQVQEKHVVRPGNCLVLTRVTPYLVQTFKIGIDGYSGMNVDKDLNYKKNTS